MYSPNEHSGRRRNHESSVQLDKHLDILTHYEYYGELIKSIIKPRNFLLVGLIAFFLSSSLTPLIINPQVEESRQLQQKADANPTCDFSAHQVDLEAVRAQRQEILNAINSMRQRIELLRPEIAALQLSSNELSEEEEREKQQQHHQLDDMRQTLTRTWQSVSELKQRHSEVSGTLSLVSANVSVLSARQSDLSSDIEIMSLKLRDGDKQLDSMQATAEEVATLRERIDALRQQQLDLVNVRSSVRAVKKSLQTIRKQSDYMQSLSERVNQIKHSLSSLQCPKHPDTASTIAQVMKNKSLPQPCYFDDTNIKGRIREAAKREVKEQMVSYSPPPSECETTKTECVCPADASVASKDKLISLLPDYAQRSAGSRVLMHKSSPTYFPVQLRFDYKIKEVLVFVGLESLSSYVPQLSGMYVYHFLGIDYGVGKYEDAISHRLTLGSCWPMQVSIC